MTLDSATVWLISTRPPNLKLRRFYNRLPLNMNRLNEKKNTLASQNTPSMVRSISEAIVIKDSNLFFLSHSDGSVPFQLPHGFGLYYNDCRYLNGYSLRLGDTEPYSLVSNAFREFMAVLQLTNEEFEGVNGQIVPKEQLGTKWKRVISGRTLTLNDSFTFQNFGLEPLTFEASFRFRAAFEDVFSVRGFCSEIATAQVPPRWNERSLFFQYRGKDNTRRELDVHFSFPPHVRDGEIVRYRLSLAPQTVQEFHITFQVNESPDICPRKKVPPVEIDTVEKSLEGNYRRWLTHEAKVESDSLSLNRAILRSFRDLCVLESTQDGFHYFAAGIPWFATLFGRDSLITAIQTLAFNPSIAEETLRLLANFQGKEYNDWREEAPGKILHELRLGELARCGHIPHTPYYGTIDATPLFLILMSRYTHWTGNLSLFRELRPAIESALHWIDSSSGEDRYLKYESYNERGLANQGWKDSWDGITNSDGSLATAPIALVEVQGYVYEAKLGMADLIEKEGELSYANQLRTEAATLKKRFNQDFWSDKSSIFALARQKGGKLAEVVASNAGHALWSGIADDDKAKRVVHRLMEEDMFSGWGIRTLSEKEKRYNPLGYHLGTVWPHDNSIIANGFKRYGYGDQALKIFEGIFRSTIYFQYQRLPELFSGFSQKDYEVPVHYPVACHPQSWAAGTVPYFIETLLGLVPNAFSHRLTIVKPQLPPFADRLEFRDLRVGDALVSLGFYRTERLSIAVEVLKLEGPLEVIVEPTVSSRSNP